MLLLLGVTACQPAESAAREDAVKVSELTVTDTERQRMEDSAKAWITMVHRYVEARDSAGLMNTLLPGARIVSAGDGDVFTVRDSAAAGLSNFTQAVTTVSIKEGEPQIDVVAAGVVAVTYPFDLTPTSKKTGKAWTSHGVYSAVLVERDGRLWVVQEHQSNRPSSTK
jgi:hypothetical protein